MTMRQIVSIVAVLAVCVCAIGAQGPAAQNPIAAGQKMLHSMIEDNIIRSAEKMPEADFAFKPTSDVRSFGQLIGHVADSQYLFCSALLGRPNPAPGIEKSQTTKAGLVQAVKDAFAYCDEVYGGLTDAQAGALVKFFGADQAKVTVLAFNTAHNNEHYGNIVTYLRMNGLVPPSSEPRK
jgi:uncharacterized damage-inducible protein DinB